MQPLTVNYIIIEQQECMNIHTPDNNNHDHAFVTDDVLREWLSSEASKETHKR